MSRVTYPGIAEIRHISASLIWNDIEMAAEAGIRPVLIGPDQGTAVPFVGEPELTEELSSEDGRRLSTSTITFKTSEAELPNHRICLLVRTVDNHWYVIGNSEQGAKVTYSRQQGIPSSCNAYTYTVEHISSHSIVEITLA